MAVNSKVWAKCPESGKEVMLWRITNTQGAYIELSSLGAGIVSVVVPDRDGKMSDVALGYPEAKSYISDGPCAGKVPGRYANRIAEGHFTLDGVQYTLPVNNGPNHLHGGPEGFFNKIWDSREKDGGIEFSLVSPDGDSGYPGELKTVVRYDWTDNCEIMLSMHAECDKATVVNLTNHVYWNLDGEGSGSIFDHVLQLNASKFLATSDSLIPAGEPCDVAGTPMDFTKPAAIGLRINDDFTPLKYGKGYDHCWMLDNWNEGELQLAGNLYSAKSGRFLQVFTTQPAVQVYTGNWLTGCPEGKNGHIYKDYDGVAIECQHPADCPNRPDFPSTVLRPGESFDQTIVFALSVK